MIQFLAKLFGLGAAQFSPIIVATSRTILSVTAVAALGGALDAVNAIDWTTYLESDKVPVALFIQAGVRMLLEGALDQLKAGK